MAHNLMLKTTDGCRPSKGTFQKSISEVFQQAIVRYIPNSSDELAFELLEVL
jgi:hypothetical protein